MARLFLSSVAHHNRRAVEKNPSVYDGQAYFVSPQVSLVVDDILLSVLKQDQLV